MGDFEKYRYQLKALADFLPLLDVVNFSAGEWISPPDKADGATPIPFKNPSQFAKQFLDMLHDVGWIVPFEWTEWIKPEEAQALFADDGDALENAAIDQLSKMLTTCVRRDRFSYGEPLLNDLELD